MRRLVVVLGAAALLGLSAAPALAEEPFRLEDQVVDQADVLGDEADIDAALEELQTEDGIQLFVVFVDSLRRRMDTNAGRSRRRSCPGSSGNDALLAVAVEDRAYGFHVPDGADVTRRRGRQLAGQAVEPEFADGDWAAGVVAFADIVRTGAAPDCGRRGRGRPAARPRRASRSSAAAPTCWPGPRRRKRAALPPPVQRIEKPDPYAGTTTEQLQGQASNALLELDEAMKTSQLDLDYARAQYGEEAVIGFDQALTQSRDELSRAFTIRQQLDDDVPEDEPTTRQMLGEMLRLTQAAGTRLDEQAEAFAQLRDLENTAPQVLDALAPRIADAAAPGSRRRSSGSPSCSSASPPRRSPRWPTTSPRRGRGWPRPSRRSRRRVRRSPRRSPATAVGDIRAAEDAVAQTATLLDAVGRLATDLEGAGGPRSPRCGPRRRRTSPRPGRSPRRATPSGLRPQIAPGRVGADLGRRRRSRGARPRSAGRPAAAGGGRHRAGAGAVGRPRRAGAEPAGRGVPRAGAADRPVDDRRGRRLHQHASGRGRPGGADPAGRGAAALRPRRGTGPGRPGRARSRRRTRPGRSPRAPSSGRRRTCPAGAVGYGGGPGGFGGGYGGGTAGAASTWAASCSAASCSVGSAAATAVVAAGSVAASAAVVAAASVAAAWAAAASDGSQPVNTDQLAVVCWTCMQFHWFLPTRGDSRYVAPATTDGAPTRALSGARRPSTTSVRSPGPPSIRLHGGADARPGPAARTRGWSARRSPR